MKDFLNFDWKDINIKYDHWFAPMIPFVKKKNRIYGKAVGKTIYFSESKEVMMQRNREGDLHFNRLIRHEFQHVYQQYQATTPVFFSRYILEWIFNLFTSWFNPYQAYLKISYEKDARNCEYQLLSDEEMGVLERSS